ncbi:MAG: hypothetical protein EPN82_09780 [Bacteroidetes bacterium]|nr:MAG: hypothetical protein EPN82_09780 [Bacteroidota bacterium]
MKNNDELNEQMNNPQNITVLFNKTNGEITITDIYGRFTPTEKENLERHFHFVIFTPEYLERVITGLEILGTDASQAQKNKLESMKSQLKNINEDYKVLRKEILGGTFYLPDDIYH